MEILEATKLLLSEQGYDKLSLRKIAAITGIHLKTLQHYFPTKEILIKATLEYVQSLYEKKIQEISSHSTDAEKNFKNYINYLVEDIKTIETAGFFYQLWAMAHVDENTNNIMEQIYQAHTDSIENLISEWFDDVVSTISNNIELHKKNYENLEHFNQLISDELSNLLSDGVKKEFVRNIEINDQLQIDHELENLFNNNESQDSDTFWKLARGSSLSFVDQSWKDHLAEMDYLRSGIGLRAMGQRDPLVEYQNEGYTLFEDLIENVKFSVIRILMNFDKSFIIQNQENKDNVKTTQIIKDKIGRNDPCYCGSGIKYKKCGMVDKCIKKS